DRPGEDPQPAVGEGGAARVTPAAGEQRDGQTREDGEHRRRASVRHDEPGRRVEALRGVVPQVGDEHPEHRQPPGDVDPDDPLLHRASVESRPPPRPGLGRRPELRTRAPRARAPAAGTYPPATAAASLVDAPSLRREQDLSRAGAWASGEILLSAG